MSQPVSVLKVWAPAGFTSRHSGKVFLRNKLCGLWRRPLAYVGSNLSDVVLLARSMHVSSVFITFNESAWGRKANAMAGTS